MRLRDLLGIIGVSSWRPANDNRATADLMGQLGVQSDEAAGAFLAVLDPTPHSGALSITRELPDALSADDSDSVGVLLLRSATLDRFPWPLLAQTLAANGWTATTAVDLDYTEITRAVVIMPGSVSAWTTPAIGPQEQLSTADQLRAARYITSLYTLTKFDLAPGLDNHSEEEADDTTVRNALFRERRRVQATLQDQIDELRAERSEATALARDRGLEISRIRASKRFLLGSLLVEAPRRPGRAASIMKRMSAATPLALPSGDASPNPAAHVPGSTLERLRQPTLEAGSGQVSVVAVGAPDVQRKWAPYVRIVEPLNANPSEILETAPEIVVVFASGLLAGRWQGVGQLSATGATMSLLDLIDEARLSGIPTVFVWDVDPSSCPGGLQIARASSATAWRGRNGAQRSLEEWIPNSVDVRGSLVLNVGGPPSETVLAVDAAIALGTLEVDTASEESLKHRWRGSSDPGMVWFGRPGTEQLVGSFSARGTAVVTSPNDLRLMGVESAAEYRLLTDDQREAHARSAMASAMTTAVHNQRHLFANHHPTLEVERMFSLAGGRFDVAPRIGIVARSVNGFRAAERLMADSSYDPGAVVVIGDHAQTWDLDVGVAVVGTPSLAADLVSQSDLSWWLVLSCDPAELIVQNMSLDAARFADSGLVDVSFVDDGRPVGRLIGDHKLLRAAIVDERASVPIRGYEVGATGLGWRS